MSEHHKEHPDYAAMGCFAGYGEGDHPNLLIELAERPKRKRWKLLGIDFHKRWRAGKTWLDNAGGDHLRSHHGFYSLEWARGPHLGHYRAYRRARAASEAIPHGR